jgi:hypothetical protein
VWHGWRGSHPPAQDGQALFLVPRGAGPALSVLTHFTLRGEQNVSRENGKEQTQVQIVTASPSPIPHLGKSEEGGWAPRRPADPQRWATCSVMEGPERRPRHFTKNLWHYTQDGAMWDQHSVWPHLGSPVGPPPECTALRARVLGSSPATWFGKSGEYGMSSAWEGEHGQRKEVEGPERRQKNRTKGAEGMWNYPRDR